MKIAVTILLMPLTVAAAISASLPASAKLTPLQQLPFVQPDVTSLHTGPAAAMLERNYFQAPQAQQIEPKRAMPCTVRMVVFDKARLAQACY